MNAITGANGLSLGTTLTTPGAQPAIGNDPKGLAQQILGETGGHGMKYDRLGQIEARLDAIARDNPQLAADVRREIMASPSLSVVDKATLTRNAPGQTIDIGGGKAVRTTPDGMDLDRWINIQRSQNTDDYVQLAKAAGSDDNAAIKTVMQEAAARGMSPAQWASAKQAETQGFDATLIADLTQMTLDITGIVDPTPISDGSNLVISLGRGVGELFSGNWSKAGEHGLNGVISGVGFLPYVGDLAKLGKLGKWAETVTKAVDAAIHNPAARQALEPALKKLHDLIGNIPESVMNKLPDEVKSTLEGIKGKLDELFGGGAKKNSDPVDVGAGTNGASNASRVPFNSFPKTPDEMTKALGVEPSKVSLTPDGTTRIVWEPNANTRIRYESHPEGLKPGDVGFNPRHHGEHYHVEIKPDGSSWGQANRKGLIDKVQPDGYTPGSGTGFLPGEKFPGK